MTSHTAEFRFYGDLNNFVDPARRAQASLYVFDEHPSVKDAIESMGVPHTEADLILIDGAAADFTFHLKDGDRIAVYPHFHEPGIVPAG